MDAEQADRTYSIPWKSFFTPGSDTRAAYDRFFNPEGIIQQGQEKCASFIKRYAKCVHSPTQPLILAPNQVQYHTQNVKAAMKAHGITDVDEDSFELPPPLPHPGKEEEADACATLKTELSGCVLQLFDREKIKEGEALSEEAIRSAGSLSDMFVFGRIHEIDNDLYDQILFECDPDDKTVETGQGESVSGEALPLTMACIFNRLWPKLFLSLLRCTLAQRLNSRDPVLKDPQVCANINLISSAHWGLLSASRAKMGRGGLKKKIQAKIDRLLAEEAKRAEAEEEEEDEGDELERVSVADRYAWFLEPQPAVEE